MGSGRKNISDLAPDGHGEEGELVVNFCGLRVMAVIERILRVEEEVEYMRPTSPSCSTLAPEKIQGTELTGGLSLQQTGMENVLSSKFTC